jgi:hypothetical protein
MLIQDVVMADLEAPRKSSRVAGGSTKNKEDANFNFPKGTPMAAIMEASLRDLIADMEDKIHMGGLGVLKVGEREKWRESIISGGYDQQCSKLAWGGKKNALKVRLLKTKTMGFNFAMMHTKRLNFDY